MKKGTAWKKLTRGDLTTFDQIATDAVLTAMSLGGVGRVSARGHVQIRAADGRTMAVGRDTSAPHCAQNVRASLRRLFPETKGESMKHELSRDIKNISHAAVFTDVQLPDATTNGVAVAPPEPPMLVCPARKCDAEFETAESRDKHVADEHLTCRWIEVEGPRKGLPCNWGDDGTPYVAFDNRGLAGHTGTRHKGNTPWMASKQASANRRAEKEAAETPPPATEKVAETTKKVADPKPEHRGLPRPVRHQSAKDADTIAEIRRIIGGDPALIKRIAELEAEVADLNAQLDLIREAAALHRPDKGRKK